MLQYFCHPNYEITQNFSKGEDLALAAVELLYYTIPMVNKIDRSVNLEPPQSLDQIIE